MKQQPKDGVVIILGPPDDRRCFDLFNWLRVEHPEWQFAITASKGADLNKMIYPGALYLPAGSSAALLDAVRAKPANTFVYLPFFEKDIEGLLAISKEWPENFRALLPKAESFLIAVNKASFTAHFQDMGLVPKSFSLAELQLHFPETGVVAKPPLGRGAIGMRFINNRSQLNHIQADDVIQEKLGDGHSVIGAFYLCYEGKVIVHHQHRRILTYPADGGVSTHAACEHIPEIAEKGTQILESLGWEGLAMLEFLPQRQTGAYLAIECNTRLWGSCLLGEYAGYAPVETYINLCLGNAVPDKPKRPNAQIVWYFPYQLLHVLKKPHRRLKKLLPEKNTCYISQTRAGMFRGSMFVLSNILNRRKWQIMWNKLRK